MIPHLIHLNTIILSLLMYSGTIGYDGSMMNGLQSLQQWQTFMNHPTGAWLGFINAIQAIGGLITYPVQAYIADRYGRKACLYAGLVFVTLGSGLQTGAKDTGMFIAARFFIGVASSLFSAAAILITEIAYPSHRGKVTALYNCQFYVGSLISAWITYGVRNMNSSWAWRIPSLLQIGIPVLAAFGTFTSPERYPTHLHLTAVAQANGNFSSPRWLISKGRNDEARAVLIKYHTGGDANAALLLFEMAEIEKTIALEREAKNSASYMDMFKTKGNRHRLLITVTLGIFSQWV
jgi:MFS family permease